MTVGTAPAHSQDAAALASCSYGYHEPAAWLAARGCPFGDAFIFVVPVLLAFQFAFGGRLFMSEVVLLLALPFLLNGARRRGASRISHGVIALGLLWLSGLIVTDLYRGTPFSDYSRGWSKVAFLLLNFAALSLLIDGRWRRVTLFTAGLALGETFQFYFHTSAYAAGDPWKFGLGPPVTLAGALLASRPAVYRRPTLAAGIFAALGVVNLRMGFRSLAGVCFLTAFLVLLAARSARLLQLDRRAVRTFAAVVASILVGIGIVEAYRYAAGDGLLGARAQLKYQQQQSSLGVLLGGRPEIVVAMRAIRDSPIVGHGSWAKDPKYVTALQDELHKAGYQGSTLPSSPDLIPTHSHLVGAWVEAGILGAVFWFWVLGLVACVLPRLHRLGDARVALVSFLAVSFLWDVLFSPFGAERRLIVPFYLIVLLLTRKEIHATAEEHSAR